MRTYNRWEKSYKSLLRFVRLYGELPSTFAVSSGINVGNWCIQQRQKERLGKLNPVRKRLLEEVPGWWWLGGGDSSGDSSPVETAGVEPEITPTDVADPAFNVIWHENLQLLKEYMTGSKATPNFFTQFRGKHIGSWCNRQRYCYSNGMLSQNQIVRLESVPGWSWSVTRSKWDTMFDTTKEYIAKKHKLPHCREKYRGRSIGPWIRVQKKKYLDSGGGVKSRRADLSDDQRGLLESLPLWELLYVD